VRVLPSTRLQSLTTHTGRRRQTAGADSDAVSLEKAWQSRAKVANRQA